MLFYFGGFRLARSKFYEILLQITFVLTAPMKYISFSTEMDVMPCNIVGALFATVGEFNLYIFISQL